MARASLLRKRKQPSLSDDESEADDQIENGNDNELQETFEYYTPPKKRQRLKNNHKINFVEKTEDSELEDSEENETDDQDLSSTSENSNETNNSDSITPLEVNNVFSAHSSDDDIDDNDEQSQENIQTQQNTENKTQDEVSSETSNLNTSTSSWTDKLKSAWLSWTGGIRSSSDSEKTNQKEENQNEFEKSNTITAKPNKQTKNNTNNSTIITNDNDINNHDDTKKVTQPTLSPSSSSNHSPPLNSIVTTKKKNDQEYDQVTHPESLETDIPEEILNEFSTPGKSKITATISRRDSNNTSLNTSLSSLSPNSSFQSDVSTTSNSRRQSSYKLRSMSFSLAQGPERRRSNLNTSSSSFVSPREPPLTPRKSSSSFRSPRLSESLISQQPSTPRRNYVPSENASINSLPAASVPITSPRRRSTPRKPQRQADVSSSWASPEERRFSLNRRRGSRRLSSMMNQDITPVKFDDVSGKKKKKSSTPSTTAKMERRKRQQQTQSYIRQKQRLSMSMSQI